MNEIGNCADGINNTNPLLADTDGDGRNDLIDVFPCNGSEWLDCDSDGTGDNADTDDDNDGVADSSDIFPCDAGETSDNDSDGVGDNTDLDDDNDGILDTYEDSALNSFTGTNIATNADGAFQVIAADMDGDGDIDIVSASARDDTIAWYENNGDADPTWTASDIVTNADAARSVFAADMDGDGDMDIVSASYIDYTIAWY